jgi:hypothetical protein
MWWEVVTVSFFSWLFPKPAPAGVAESPRLSAGSALAELKKQRHERRDQLYGVVRDVMKNSEVLAPHYKFKVLSLDTQGSQFLVMIDVMSGPIMSAGTLTHIENLLSIAAEDRHALRVKAVYWRQLEGAAQSAALAPAPQAAKPAVVQAPVVAKSAAAPAPVGRGGEKSQGFEPIGQDEMMAFKQAIASAVTVIAPAIPGSRKPGAAPGFEDTQLLDADEGASPLSRTQFGDLK